MIIDAHVHLGEDVVFDEATTESELVEYYDQYDVDGGIVQPYVTRPYIKDIRASHDRIHRFTRDARKRWWGMISMHPHLRPEEYDAEAARCVKELGFVGIKITPIGHACHPSSKAGLHVFEVCRSLNVPLMIHTGSGVPFSDPISIVKALESFPEVVVVLAHAGSEMHHQQATYLARKFENVYLEPSWVGTSAVSGMLRQLGSEKIMFSSDMLVQIPVELAKYRSVTRDPAALDNIFYKNVSRVYRLGLE